MLQKQIHRTNIRRNVRNSVRRIDTFSFRRKVVHGGGVFPYERINVKRVAVGKVLKTAYAVKSDKSKNKKQ